jgi:hypothetical protein
MIGMDVVFQFDKEVNRQSIVCHFAMDKFNAQEMRTYLVKQASF